MIKGTSTIWLRSDPSIFGAVRKFVSQTVRLLGGSNTDALELEVATGEALANAYRHAYRNTYGPVQVDLTYDDRKIEISIHDDGDAIFEMPNSPSISDQRGEHHGLSLMGKLTDRTDIVHPRNEHGGTTVRMTKYIGKARWLAGVLQVDAGQRGDLLG